MYQLAWSDFTPGLPDMFLVSYPESTDFFFQLVFENLIYPERLNGLNLFSLCKIMLVSGL